MATTVLVSSTRSVDALADLPEVRAVRFVPTEIPETRMPDNAVLITPRVAGSTFGDEDRAWRVAREQIIPHLAGRTPANLVG